MRFWLILTLLIFASAQANDALAPKTQANAAAVSPLKRIVISTNALAESKLFYVDGLGLTLDGPISLSRSARKYYQAIWQLDNNNPWQLYRLHRQGLKQDIAEIDLVVFKRAIPASQDSWNALQLGPLSIGFPNAKQQTLDAHIRKLGFGALNLLESYSIPRPDGSSYSIDETIFTAPDFVRAVGVQRGDGMAQLGVIDDKQMGGPAYVAMVVEDSDRMIAFMREVLGYELRSDRQWKSAGSKGALNVPDGTEFRFAILYAPIAASGHVLLLDFQNVAASAPKLPARVGTRGIGMWTFAAPDLDAVKRKAEAFGATVLDFRKQAYRKALVIQAPNGFQLLIEQGLGN